MAETRYTDQAYGEAQAQEEALDAVPMADILPNATNQPVKAGSAGNFLRPSERPVESVMQPGALLANEVNSTPIYSANALNVLSNLFTLSDYGSTSDSTRQVISAIENLATLSHNKVVPT